MEFSLSLELNSRDVPVTPTRTGASGGVAYLLRACGGGESGDVSAYTRFVTADTRFVTADTRFVSDEMFCAWLGLFGKQWKAHAERGTSTGCLHDVDGSFVGGQNRGNNC